MSTTTDTIGAATGTAASAGGDILYRVDAKKVRAEIGKERLIAMFRKMLLVRHFEERADQNYKAKKIAGFLHLYIGQEAVATAFYDHLKPGRDYTVTSYRCHAQALLAGLDPKELMAELFGKVTGNVRGKGGSMHFFSKEKGMLGGHGIVGGQIPVGTGAAFTAKYLGNGGVSLTFLGDGASPQGTFHESLNIAGLWRLPAIYLIENNMYGMGTACSRAVAVKNIAEAKAPGYNLTSFTYDGLDLYASWKVAQEAIALARRNEPVLIEAKTYRYRGHSVSDPALYRSKDELAKYQALDPIERIKADLIAEKWLSADEAERINEETLERIQAAVAFADESPEPPPSELTRHVYAE
ncbi:MAG: pyruvate dehydrogenase (acetyl-transferring) E1 component subunit alpha [Planctomycetes bacterium]|nr:pyruvate dehydrogenase (acetyl-transferring) E1 component subunit alpha [Planctomycetota bacterium]